MSETYHLILIIFLGSSLPILNLLFFLLAARQNVWAWVAGGLYAAASFGMTLSLSSPTAQVFDASRIFQLIVELLLFAYGAFLWHKNGHRFFNQPAGKYFPVSSLLKQYFSVREQLVLSGILLVAILLLSRSGFSYLNFAIYAISLVLLAHKKIEGWILRVLTMALSALSLPDLHYILPHILKLTVFVYGFLCWKAKLGKKEEIERAALSSLIKTGALSLLYIALAIAAPFVVTYFVCRGGSGCSGIPAGFFVFGFPMVSLVIAAVILFVKKEHFRQWQLFFIANGLFGLEVLNLLQFVMKMPGMFR